MKSCELFKQNNDMKRASGGCRSCQTGTADAPLYKSLEGQAPLQAVCVSEVKTGANKNHRIASTVTSESINIVRCLSSV